MKNRIFTLIVAVTVLLLILVACGGRNSISDGTFRAGTGWEFQISGDTFVQVMPSASGQIHNRGTFTLSGNELTLTITEVLVQGAWVEGTLQTLTHDISNITDDSFQMGMLVFTRID